MLELVPLYSLTDGESQWIVSVLGGGEVPPCHSPRLGVGSTGTLSGGRVSSSSNRKQVALQGVHHHRRCCSSEVGIKPSPSSPFISTKDHSRTKSAATSHSHSTTAPESGSGSESPPAIVPAGEIGELLRDVAGMGAGQRQVGGDRELYMLLFSVLESVLTLRGGRGTSKVGPTLRLLQGVTTLFEDTLGLWLQLHNKSPPTQRAGLGGGGTAKHNRRTRSADYISLGDGVGVAGEELRYGGCLHLARVGLRLWLRLSSQLLHSDLREQHLSELQPLLHAPLEAVSRACYNLQQGGVFRGSPALDHEFTLMILEALLAGLGVVNHYPRLPACQVSNLYQALRDLLTDACQEWFAYLCSKLHGVSGRRGRRRRRGSGDHAPSFEVGVSEQNGKQQEDGVGEGEEEGEGPDWEPVLSYSYSLLTHILAQLLTTSHHIRTCQQAFKLALASAGNSFKTSASTTSSSTSPSSPTSPASTFPFNRPVTYNLEEATGFDKLTFRLSKMAELLLTMFRDVPRVQLLSLRLLSETTRDTIGIIGSFLSIVSDRSVYTSPQLLDPYLELLEEAWFRLSPDYAGSAPWGKVSAYSRLLMESGQHQVTCQALHHLHCLFGHASGTLRAQLTKRVVIPYHTHLMALVREKCYGTSVEERGVASTGGGGGGDRGATAAKKPRGGTKSGDVGVSGTSRVKMGSESDLADDQRVILSLFLRLLVKVVSHPQSLGTFASSGANLYVLFLLFPLDQFRTPGLRVLEECLYTIHNFGCSSGGSWTSPPNSGVPSPASTPGGGSGGSPLPLGEVLVTQRPDETGIQKTLLQILLSVAYSVQIERIPDQCLSIAEGRATLTKYGLAESDEVCARMSHDTCVSLLCYPDDIFK